MKTFRLMLACVLVLAAACSSLRHLDLAAGPEFYAELYFRITDAAPVPRIDFAFADLSYLATPSERYVGLCDDAAGTPLVTLDPEYWAESDEIQREILVLHELGHCVGDIEHDSQRWPDNCPVSIMFPKVLTSDCYRRHKFEYWRDLQAKSR